MVWPDDDICCSRNNQEQSHTKFFVPALSEGGGVDGPAEVTQQVFCQRRGGLCYDTRGFSGAFCAVALTYDRR